MTVSTRAVVVDRPVHEVFDDWVDGPGRSRLLGHGKVHRVVASAMVSTSRPASVVKIVVREIATAARRELVWLSVAGPRVAGRLTFHPVGAAATCVRLTVDFGPEEPARLDRGFHRRTRSHWRAGARSVPRRGQLTSRA